MRCLVVAALLAALAVPAAADLAALYRRPSAQWPAAWIDPGVAFEELAAATPASAAPQDAARAALGARLFADPRLSASGRIACASCHQPAHGWSVPAPVARGEHGASGRRNPPDLRNAPGHARWGWDGRGASLAAQSLAPLTAPHEMANPALEPVIARLRAAPGHAQAFARAYGTREVTAAHLGDALAAYQAGLARQAPPTRFDRFAQGEWTALDAQEIRGLHLFRTKARCANCHFGPRLSDGKFHNLRISSFGEKAQDLGRHAVTGRAEDAGAFRTPSLRRVRESPPYMHSGLFASLEGAINLYDRGGGEVWARNAAEADHPLYPHAARLSPHIRPLGLSEDEKAALAAFLRAL